MPKHGWPTKLNYDPLPPLVTTSNVAIQHFARRDLLRDVSGGSAALSVLPEALRIVSKQQPNGSWKYPGARAGIRSEEDYDQLETYRNLGYLVEKYGLNTSHSAIAKAAEYLFSIQSRVGDFRGIYGHQYTPNYSAGFGELLIKSGFAGDPRIEKLLEWLMDSRQHDGGWAIPLRTRRANFSPSMKKPLMEPDKDRPSSHLVTGVVLRAFAAHPERRHLPEVISAAELLAGRLFQRDAYPDRKAPDFWLRFSYPFWYTDLLSALDSLSLIGLPTENRGIKEGLKWLIDNQQSDGTWRVKLVRGADKDLPLWISLAICRVFKRFYQR